jgi:hypothetical protein
MKSALYQSFSDPSGLSAELYVMDFGTSNAAAAMFEKRKSDNQEIHELPGRSLSQAFKIIPFDYIAVYAHYANVYIEISVLGLDDLNKLSDKAVSILSLYESKTVQ